jgi:fructuronate reductase
VQDGLYTLIERSQSAPRLRVIGALRECLLAGDAPETTLARLADPRVRIVSLTITEKGYCLDAQGQLDRSSQGLCADLAAGAGADLSADLGSAGGVAPRTALGWLARGLARRRDRAPEAALTLMSCDNLPTNGKALRSALLAFVAAAGDTALEQWIEQRVSFPCSMVDRIVPATTDADRETVHRIAGLADAWPVSTEPFTQWVVEDRFAAGRPDLAASGVQLANDVGGWEDMKLRLLNAAHSFIAYTGLLAGLNTVDQAITQPALRAAVERLWDEAIPTLPSSMQPLAPDYCRQLLTRFANPALAHRTEQIAADGSKKIPVRWLPTIRQRLAQGSTVGILGLALAAWLQCLRGGTLRPPISLKDPIGDALAQGLQSAGTEPQMLARALLSVKPLFADLTASERLVDSIAAHLRVIDQSGPLAALAQAAGRT